MLLSMMFRTASAAFLIATASQVLGETKPFDTAPYTHPELRPLVEPIRKYQGEWELNDKTLEVARKPYAPSPPLEAPSWREQIVPGSKGHPPVRVYVINERAGGAPRAAILHMHGGGFVLGDAKSSIRRMQEIASALDVVIVTVDYRLAPEVRFPGSLEDNYAGLKWLHDNAQDLGVDPTRIALLGESAGGGHAAMLALAARDRGEVPVAFQALIYPMLDDRTGSTNRKPPYMGFVIWDEQRNRYGWTSLLGVPAGSSKVPDGAVPARVSNLRNLPPAYITVGTADLFVEEDLEYARRLVAAGVQVDMDLVAGAFHGFEAMGSASLAKRFNTNLYAALSRGLALPEPKSAKAD